MEEAKPGNKILLDLENMMEYRRSDTNSEERIGRIKLRPVEVKGRFYALISDSVIDCIDGR
jgi:hypothetical protein